MRCPLFPVLLIALVLGGAFLATRPDEAPGPEPPTDNDAAARAGRATDAATSPSPIVRDAAPDVECVSIVVADAATGRAISGASCAGLTATPSYVDPSRVERLGSTDDAGRLRLADGGDETAYLLTHPDYVATFVEREAGVLAYSAEMQKGVRLTFTAATREGAVLQGVKIAVAPEGDGARSRFQEEMDALVPGVGRNGRAVAVTGRDGRAALGPVSPGALSWAIWHDAYTAVSFEPVEWARHPELVPGGEVRVWLDPVVGMLFAVSEPVLNWMARTPKGLHVSGTSVHDLEHRRRRIAASDPTGRTVCVLYPVRYDPTDAYGRRPDKGRISILTEAHGWTDLVADIRPLTSMSEPQFLDLGERPQVHPTTRVEMLWQADGELPPITTEHALLTPVTEDPEQQHRQVLLRPGEQAVVPCGDYSLEAANPFLANVLRGRRVSINHTTQTVDVHVGELKYVEIVTTDTGDGTDTTGIVRISAGETSRTVTVQGGRVWSLVPPGEVRVHVDFGRSNGEAGARITDHGQTIRVPLSVAR